MLYLSQTSHHLLWSSSWVWWTIIRYMRYLYLVLFYNTTTYFSLGWSTSQDLYITFSPQYTLLDHILFSISTSCTYGIIVWTRSTKQHYTIVRILPPPLYLLTHQDYTSHIVSQVLLGPHFLRSYWTPQTIIETDLLYSMWHKSWLNLWHISHTVYIVSLLTAVVSCWIFDVLYHIYYI